MNIKFTQILATLAVVFSATSQASTTKFGNWFYSDTYKTFVSQEVTHELPKQAEIYRIDSSEELNVGFIVQRQACIGKVGEYDTAGAYLINKKRINLAYQCISNNTVRLFPVIKRERQFVINEFKTKSLVCISPTKELKSDPNSISLCVSGSGFNDAYNALSIDEDYTEKQQISSTKSKNKHTVQ
jgi:hypothetical protein